MKIFLCATPYHLMVAHAIRDLESRDPHSDPSHLILSGTALLTDPRLIIDSWWTKIHEFRETFFLRQALKGVAAIDHWVRHSFDDTARTASVDFYTGNDTDVRNQILITAFPGARIHLFEDGIGSYVVGGWNNAPARRFFRKLTYKTILRRRYFNSSGLSSSEAQGLYGLRPDVFPLARRNGLEVNLVRINLGNYVHILKERISLPQADGCLVLSEPLDEYMDLKKQASVYANLIIQAANPENDKLWIKMHPSEPRHLFVAKKREIEKMLGGINLQPTPLEAGPIEAIAACGLPYRSVCGVMSTALANIKMLSPATFVFSGFDLMPVRAKKSQMPYRIVLAKIGVQFVA